MEVLFIVTVIFVAYVVYSVVGNINKQDIPEEPVAPQKKPAARTAAKPAAKPAERAAAKPTPKPVEKATEKATAKPSPKPAESSGGSKEVRNPATGETVAIPSNYRFTKRWIKEALVEEGLLDKVYKNTELDDAASAKVKDALAKFREIEKYQA